MKNTNISKREAQTLNEIKTRDMIIFTPQDIKHFLNISNENTHRILRNMKQKNLIKRIEKGKYILTDHWNNLDIYEIVPEIYTPSYLAFWNALHFHKMTEQVPRKIFMITTKRKQSIELQNQKIQYITLKKKFFFGYERYGKTIVSNPEKTIIDCLKHPEYAGGIPHIYEATPTTLNIPKIIHYCIKTKSSTIASRLGYILDQKKLITEKKDTKKLKNIIQTYTKLDPTKNKINPNSKWKIYANRRIK